jgi:NADPH2:quinone reductase
MRSHAIVMRRTGPPEVLKLEPVDLPPLQRGDVRIRALASAVNHSDLEIRAGNWNIRREPRFPYVPGLEVVGEVVEVAGDVVSVVVGDRVWTTMQGLGGVRAERDGGYAELVTVAASVVAPLPNDVDPVAFAAIGLAGVTAYAGLKRLGVLAGKTVLVTGARGGVGAVAILIARAGGANVVAHHRDAPVPPRGVDAVLDVVAGPLFPSLVAALRHGGRYCLVGAVGGGEVRFDAWSLIDGLTLTGYSTEDLDGNELRAATKALLDLRLPSVAPRVLPLADAARAHDMLERREVGGRIVLVPKA